MSLDKETVKYDNEGNKWVLVEGVKNAMYSAVDVAWKMLQIAKSKDIELSNLQLQKLVYIAHGYLLGWKGEPLIKEQVEAWKYGPVISSIYHTFKEYGSNKIPTTNIDKLESIDIPDEYAQKCIEGVLDLYGKDAPENLVSATHQVNTPWHNTWEVKGGKRSLFSTMDNTEIKNHYMKVISTPESVQGL